MAESRHEICIVALKAALESISADGGASYHYTPDVVLRAPAFSQLCLDSSLETIYVLSPEDVAEVHGDSCDEKDTVRVDLTALRKYDLEENPFTQNKPATLLRWTVQTRLERDVKKLTRANFNLGGAAQEVTVPLVSYAPEETFFKGWACVFMHLEIKINSPRATP